MGKPVENPTKGNVRDPWTIHKSGFTNTHNYSQESIKGNQDGKNMGYREWWNKFYDDDLSNDYRWGMTGGYTSSIDHGRLNKNGDMHGSSFKKGKYLPTWNRMRGDYKTYLTSNQAGSEGSGSLNYEQGISTASDGTWTAPSKKRRKASDGLGL